MLFYQMRFDIFTATYNKTPEEFYCSKDARSYLGFPSVLRKKRDFQLWQNYAFAYAELYAWRQNPQMPLI